MSVTAWRCALAVVSAAALSISATSGPAAATCQLQEIGELPITFDHDRLLVQASINGRPAKMVIDTGATNTLILSASAQAMGLAIRPLAGVKFYGVGGEAGSGVVRITDFRVANLSAHNDDVLVSGRQPLGEEQGLLGADFLLQADMEIDVAGGRLRFFRPKGCAGDQVVYWGKAYAVARMLGSSADRKIEVMVRVGDTPILAEMDTGAGHSIVTPAAAARAGITPTSAGVTRVKDSHGLGAKAVPTYVGVFSSFSFGDETIKNATLAIADMFAADKEVQLGSRIASPAIDSPQMLLGADFFRAHRVYVATSQKAVYVSYVGGPVFQTRAEPAPGGSPP